MRSRTGTVQSPSSGRARGFGLGAVLDLNFDAYVRFEHLASVVKAVQELRGCVIRKPGSTMVCQFELGVDTTGYVTPHHAASTPTFRSWSLLTDWFDICARTGSWLQLPSRSEGPPAVRDDIGALPVLRQPSPNSVFLFRAVVEQKAKAALRVAEAKRQAIVTGRARLVSLRASFVQLQDELAKVRPLPACARVRRASMSPRLAQIVLFCFLRRFV